MGHSINLSTWHCYITGSLCRTQHGGACMHWNRCNMDSNGRNAWCVLITVLIRVCGVSWLQSWLVFGVSWLLSWLVFDVSWLLFWLVFGVSWYVLISVWCVLITVLISVWCVLITVLISVWLQSWLAFDLSWFQVSWSVPGVLISRVAKHTIN